MSYDLPCFTHVPKQNIIWQVKLVSHKILLIS